MAPRPPEGSETRESPFAFAETVARLEAALHAKGLTIFARIDHSGEAQRVGLSLPPTVVLIFGNPRAGTPLMVSAPLIALDLPLKLLIWEGADGRVRVSYTNGTFLATRYGLPAELSPTLTGFAAIVATTLRT